MVPRRFQIQPGPPQVIICHGRRTTTDTGVFTSGSVDRVTSHSDRCSPPDLKPGIYPGWLSQYLVITTANGLSQSFPPISLDIAHHSERLRLRLFSLLRWSYRSLQDDVQELRGGVARWSRWAPLLYEDIPSSITSESGPHLHSRLRGPHLSL